MCARVPPALRPTPPATRPANRRPVTHVLPPPPDRPRRRPAPPRTRVRNHGAPKWPRTQTPAADQTAPPPAGGAAILDRLAADQSLEEYRQEHWQGSFAEYLDLVRENPAITRTAYQRLYDMIVTYGTYPVGDEKEGLIRYRFFDDPETGGRNAIFGLTRTLTDFVNTLKSAALGYGTERRVILLHGPVGSSKVDHRGPAEKGPGTLQPDRRRGPVHVRLGGDGRRNRRKAGPVGPDARRTAATDPRGAAGGDLRDAERRPARGGPPGDDHRGGLPALPVPLQGAPGGGRRGLDEGDGGRSA